MATKTKKSTKTHTANPPYRASKEVADALQQLHVDVIDLHLVAKQAHWNTVGQNFRDLHLQLDEVTAAARSFSDEIAERMRAIYITPDGRSTTVAKSSSLPEFPPNEVDTGQTVDLIVTAIYAACSTARDHFEMLDEADPPTADLINGVLARFEQLAWMIDAENRTANKSSPKPIKE